MKYYLAELTIQPAGHVGGNGAVLHIYLNKPYKHDIEAWVEALNRTTHNEQYFNKNIPSYSIYFHVNERGLVTKNELRWIRKCIKRYGLLPKQVPGLTPILKLLKENINKCY